MTRLEGAITNLVDVFLEYAGDDPKKPKLCQEELQNLLANEIKTPEIRVRDIGHNTKISLKVSLTMTLSSLRRK